jgi:hypothetical protein
MTTNNAMNHLPALTAEERKLKTVFNPMFDNRPDLDEWTKYQTFDFCIDDIPLFYPLKFNKHTMPAFLEAKLGESREVYQIGKSYIPKEIVEDFKRYSLIDPTPDDEMSPDQLADYELWQLARCLYRANDENVGHHSRMVAYHAYTIDIRRMTERAGTEDENPLTTREKRLSSEAKRKKTLGMPSDIQLIQSRQKLAITITVEQRLRTLIRANYPTVSGFMHTAIIEKLKNDMVITEDFE